MVMSCLMNTTCHATSDQYLTSGASEIEQAKRAPDKL